MNVRGAAVQSGLAALGLVVAYTTWQREPERAPGEVLVVDVINDLESAGVRLVDRQLHVFKPGDYDAVTISAGGKSRTLSAPPSENQFAAKLVNAKTGKPDDMAKNWHDKVWRLMVTE